MTKLRKEVLSLFIVEKKTFSRNLESLKWYGHKCHLMVALRRLIA